MKGVDEMDGRALFGFVIFIAMYGFILYAYLKHNNIQEAGDKVIKSVVSKIENENENEKKDI